jgi:tRNA/tmRNA/rRNA uracil-C5-methylase (TrmA/RlmC/RlmD family)
VSDETQGAGNVVVRVLRPATGGGVGRLDDGRIVFVRHSLPGELVEVELTQSTAKFSRGDAVRILEKSPERVSVPCPYAHPRGCGGCDLQHASPLAQSQWKAALVQEHLERIAGISRLVEVLSTSTEVKGSRTRLRCAVDEDGRLCLRGSRSRDLVALDACWISSGTLRPAFSTSWSGAEEVELRAIGEGEPFAVVRRETTRGEFTEVRSLRGEPLDPSTKSRVMVDGHVYSVSPQSFWQSHRSAPQLLVDVVKEFADAKEGDHAVDLFSGVGLFTVPLAKAVGARGLVTAVESSPHAVRDARENSEGVGSVKVREWSVRARAINDSVAPGDVVILDPPRHGLAKGVVDALVRRSPRRVVYVSCDAATFARDLRAFLAGGFELVDLRVIDLFPMTEHVEIVGLLDKGA